MKILLEKDDGSTVEIRRIEGVSPDAKLLLISIDTHLRPSDAYQIEKTMTEKTGKACVILPYRTTQIWGT